MENAARNSHVVFNPSMDLDDEFEVIREARKSLGGSFSRGIEIDMDILADAYPQEANFMSSENIPPISPNRMGKGDGSPKTPQRNTSQLKTLSTKKTPNRRFFKSENEREYARNLMKELVPLYILQGNHGKQAFRDALNETRRRIYLRRGEDPPSPPAVTSPVYVSPYPKLQPPMEAKSRTTPVKLVLPPAVPEVRPVSEFTKSPLPIQRGTPSRVKEIVSAINSTPKKLETEKTDEKQTSRTPGSAKIKAVVECIEATVAANTPNKRVVASATNDDQKTPGTRKGKISRQKAEATPTIPESTRPKRKAAAAAVSESEKETPQKKNEDAAVKKKKATSLEPIPETQDCSRPSRRAKMAANQSIIKK